ncbi:hypothetical protein GGX14DRAFT_387364 [Mycena pura]|uniref:Uncharacterized protein n=1 Tax=Mycena pura TaxID=153505 RepID=A0AAD7E2G8_9AGAR|nr:hypothetical protein GGX14DRAFT_387364 [Mycena pura]
MLVIGKGRYTFHYSMYRDVSTGSTNRKYTTLDERIQKKWLLQLLDKIKAFPPQAVDGVGGKGDDEVARCVSNDDEVVVVGERALALGFLGEAPARQRRGAACWCRRTLALAVQSGKLDGVEGLVNESREGRYDVVLVVSDRVHTAEEKGLVSDDIESIGLRDGNPSAETEVEVVVIWIRSGVKMQREERGEVGPDGSLATSAPSLQHLGRRRRARHGGCLLWSPVAAVVRSPRRARGQTPRPAPLAKVLARVAAASAQRDVPRLPALWRGVGTEAPPRVGEVQERRRSRGGGEAQLVRGGREGAGELWRRGWEGAGTRVYGKKQQTGRDSTSCRGATGIARSRLALAGGREDASAGGFWTGNAPGVDVHRVVVSEERHRVVWYHRGGYRGGRKEKRRWWLFEDACLASA